MKTSFLLLSVLLVAAGRAADVATVPPCCRVEKTAPAATAPVSAHSIYQLDATWTDDAGRARTLAGLRGRPVVLAMFFASCEYACPVLVRDVQRLRDLLPAGLRDETQFVLVSFDTARDTVPALRAYRERMHLDAGWTLLRGDEAGVQELAMLLGVKFKQDARGQFAHSNLFTLLNREGEIVHQHAGLNGDVSAAAQALTHAAR